MSKTEPRDYFLLLKPHINRVVSMIDKNSASSTYGCFDRNYWHYKLIDTPSARFQEGTLFLTLLYVLDRPDNIYFGSPTVKSWITAALKYWQQIQAKDGSFNEWYPKEQSFVSTAFSLYAVSESCLLLGEIDPELLAAITKAADWLVSKQEFTVCNQQSGAVIGLYNVWLLTHKQQYRDASNLMLNSLLSKQTTEGWFPEYGGADMGYSLVLVDYLGKYYQKTKDPKVERAISKLLSFLAITVQPDGSIGGEIGSRNTTYYLPHGLEIFSHQKSASFLKDKFEQFTKNYGLHFDDRYLLNNGYTFLQAQIDQVKIKRNIKRNKNYQYLFSKSGLFVKSTSNYFLISNLNKGVVKVFDREKYQTVFDNSGIILEFDDQKWGTSVLAESKFGIENNEVHTTKDFYKISELTMSSQKLVGSRLVSFVFGLIPFVVPSIKKLLREMLITGKKSKEANCKIKIVPGEKEILVFYTIHLNTAKQVRHICAESKHALIYVPSSRLFVDNDIFQATKYLSDRVVKILNSRKQLTYLKRITL